MEENTNQIADEKVGEQVEAKPSEKKTGWSWLGFFFSGYYYAGYGNLKIGLLYAVLSAIPNAGIVIAIIAGINAKKDLPVGQIKFVWKNLIPIFFVMILSVYTNIKITAFMDELKNQESTEQYETQYETQSEMTSDEAPSKLNLCAVKKDGKVFVSGNDFPFDDGIADKYLSRIFNKNIEMPLGDVKIALKVSYYSEENIQCYMVNKFTISSKKDSKEETSSEKEDILKLVRELDSMSFLF